MSAIIWAPTYEAITTMATAGMARAIGPAVEVAGTPCFSVNAVKIISFVLLRRVLRPPQYLIAQSIKVAGLQSCRVTDFCHSLPATRHLLPFDLDGLPGSLPPAKAGDYNKECLLWALVIA